MNVQRTRVIVGALAFALASAAVIDSASAQLFRRNRRNACCNAPVTTCCTNHGHYGNNSYQPTYATSYSGGYGMSSGYVSTGARPGCCGSTNMGTQVQTYDSNRTYSGSTFAAPGSSSSQQYSGQSGQNQNQYQNSYQTYKPVIQGANPDYRSDADRQQQSGEFRNDLQLNQNGTIRSNTDLNLNRDSTNQGSTDLNLDHSIRSNTDLNPDKNK